MLWRYGLRVLPLVTFYLYGWCLRQSVREWLEDVRWQDVAPPGTADDGGPPSTGSQNV